MPMIVWKRRRLSVEPITRGITRMGKHELIAYEAELWKWIPTSQKARDMLNAVHREVEWRAQDSEFE